MYPPDPPDEVYLDVRRNIRLPVGALIYAVGDQCSSRVAKKSA